VATVNVASARITAKVRRGQVRMVRIMRELSYASVEASKDVNAARR
jgi:hypothetical protein